MPTRDHLTYFFLQVFIQSTTTTSSTLINDKVLSGALTALSHGDIITIVDRKFRFEFPDDSRFYPHKSPKSKSPRTPKRASMVSLTMVRVCVTALG